MGMILSVLSYSFGFSLMFVPDDVLTTYTILLMGYLLISDKVLDTHKFNIVVIIPVILSTVTSFVISLFIGGALVFTHALLLIPFLYVLKKGKELIFDNQTNNAVLLYQKVAIMMFGSFAVSFVTFILFGGSELGQNMFTMFYFILMYFTSKFICSRISFIFALVSQGLFLWTLFEGWFGFNILELLLFTTMIVILSVTSLKRGEAQFSVRIKTI